MLSNPKRQCALFVHQFDNLVSRQSYVANVQLVNQAIKEQVWPLTLTNIVHSRFEVFGNDIDITRSFKLTINIELAYPTAQSNGDMDPFVLWQNVSLNRLLAAA